MNMEYGRTPFSVASITKFGLFLSVLSQNSESGRQKNSGETVFLHGSAGVGLLLHAEKFHLLLPGVRQVDIMQFYQNPAERFPSQWSGPARSQTDLHFIRHRAIVYYFCV